MSVWSLIRKWINIQTDQTHSTLAQIAFIFQHEILNNNRILLLFLFISMTKKGENLDVGIADMLKISSLMIAFLG